MHRMRKKGMLAMLALLTLALAATTATAGPDATREYVVVYEQGTDAAAARAAVERAGGQVVDENLAVGVATVQSRDENFVTRASAQDELFGAARNEAIGQAPELERQKEDEVEELAAIERQAATDDGERRRPTGEPLADRQWDMEMIGATPRGSYRRELGDRSVKVGIIDTGIDASHPDIAPNFDRRLSQNFTMDDPVVDGSCASDPDGSCEDPDDVDEGGHGTHVAGTVGAALNGLGVSGVAPKVKLVNLRAGQDSGYFFLQPSVDALTYAGDNGIDVVNMSYYIDPWLFNCTDGPDDTPEERIEQTTILEATQRSLDYARERGVTLVGSMGNGHSDKTRPAEDDTSPDYPPGAEREDRRVHPGCRTMPNEGDGVLSITALAPSKRKSYYSDYGYGEADLSAPGGDAYDGRPAMVQPQPDKQVLSTYPESVLRRANLIDANGEPRSASVVKSCKGDTCAYYRYLQGTSMASPHAAGVAALAVSRLGSKRRGEFGLHPGATEFAMRRTATDTACPEPRTFVYQGFPPPATAPHTWDATCEGPPENNGFYGDGIVDAERVASLGGDSDSD